MNWLRQHGLDPRGIGWFVAIAYTLNWLLALPMWLDGHGLQSPWARVIIAMNFVPSVALLFVTRWISPLPQLRRATGVCLGVKGSGWGWYWLFGWLGLVACSIAAPFVAALLGLYELDPVHFSGYRAAIEAMPGGTEFLARMPIEVWVPLFMLSFPLQTLMLIPLAFGEEWGWRGYLLPRLLPLGQWPALLIIGAIWGLWHAPVILLGFNYPQHPVLGVLVMVGSCMLIGTLLGWLRLASGSVWPAVLGHAGLNASAGAIIMLAVDANAIDTTQVGMLGWSGWIVPLLVIAFLVITRRLPVRTLPKVSASTGLAPPPAPHHERIA